MENVAAIVVTYNRKVLLKQCIERLKMQTVSLDILVVDNASTDGTEALFKNNTEHIYYINTGSNIGGAGGFNLGIKKAVELGYKYIWVMDDDTMPMGNALEEFLKKDAILFGKYGFLSSKVLWKDESICLMNIPKVTKWKQLKEFDKERKIQYSSFVSLFLKADTVKKVGLPYKEFFIWADDWEYTRRISKTEKCYFIPSSIVNHMCANNIGANIVTSTPDRMERFKYMYRNDVVLYRQDGLEGKLYLFIRNLIHRLRIIRDGSNVREKLKLIRNATKEGKKFYPIIDFPGDK